RAWVRSAGSRSFPSSLAAVRTRSSPGDTLARLGVRRVLARPVFSSAPSLGSTSSDLGLECAARDDTGCQVQGPEDGGAAALGGFQPITGCFGAGRRLGRAAGRLEAGPG